jgi:hypothetical protein
MPLPAALQRKLINDKNPTGTITNSNLELAIIILGSMLTIQSDSHPFRSILLASHNTPAFAWAIKGSVTSNTVNAFLLHHLARQCHAWQYDLIPGFTLGTTNHNRLHGCNVFAVPHGKFLLSVGMNNVL